MGRQVWDRQGLRKNEPERIYLRSLHAMWPENALSGMTFGHPTLPQFDLFKINKYYVRHVHRVDTEYRRTVEA
jgi:hypothetical protein